MIQRTHLPDRASMPQAATMVSALPPSSPNGRHATRVKNMNVILKALRRVLHAAALRSAILMMPLALVPVVAQAQAPFDQSRTSTFTYYQAADGVKNGLLRTETVEPNDPQLCVTTTYTYDANGNRTGATSANCGVVTGTAAFPSRNSTSTFATQTVTLAGISATIPVGTFATSSKVALTANIADAASHTESRTYDPRFGTVLKLIGPNGSALATNWEVDDLGRKTRELRADGTSTVNFYCYIAGRVSDLSTNTSGCPAPGTSEIPTDAIAFVHTEQRNAACITAANCAFGRTYTDRAGRTIRSVSAAFDGATQPGGAGRLIVQDADYSRYGPQTVATQPYFLDTGSSAATGIVAVGMTYTDVDVLGRPTATYTTDIASVVSVGGAVGGNIGGSQGSASFGNRGSRQAAKTSVDYTGLVTTTTNDKGQTRVEEKNVDGKLVRVTDALLAQVAYQHDAFGNLVVTQDALQNQVKVDYDKRGRKIAMTDPDTGYWQYEYDALGQLVRQQSPNQRALATATTMVYDRLGRMTSRIADDTSTWFYDTYADLTACNKGKGKLCESGTTAGTGMSHKLVYDNLGRMINSRATVVDGPSFASAVTYDTNGRLATQTYPTGLQVKYNYTAKGFLSTLTLPKGAVVTPLPVTTTTTLALNAVLWQAQAYNARGQAERQVYGNNVISKAAFDASTGRATGTTAGLANATNVLNHGYVWDSIGHLAQRNDANGEDPNGDLSAGAVSDAFAYDSLGRLTGYTVSAPQIAGQSRTVALQYNALGMTLYKSDVGIYMYGAQATAGVKPHALQRVTGSATTNYTYDANGNLSTTDAGMYRSITYNSFNLPDSNTGMQGPNGTPKYSWVYDENRQRTKETQVTAAGTRTTWSLHPNSVGGLAFESESSTANPTPNNRHYLSAGGVSIGVLVSSGALPTLTAAQTAPTVLKVNLVKVEYWHKDHLGSLIATTNHAGTVTARYSYDPFGKRRSTHGNYDAMGTIVYDWVPNTNRGTDRGYTGHEHLDDLGLIHMNGRIFDPTLGRFMQGDPLIQDAGNLQNYDRYGYCYNNPLICSDPSGYGFADFMKWVDPATFYTVRFLSHSQVGRLILSFANAYGSTWCGPFVGVCAGVGTATIASISGASDSDALKAGFISGATAQAFYAVGSATTGEGGAATRTASQQFANVAGHAVVGCASAEASGGSCGSGAASAAVGAAWSNYGYQDKGSYAVVVNLATTSAVGGLASLAGGGTFESGAKTAAFGYLFNELLHLGRPDEAMKRSGYAETKYNDGTFCNIQSAPACGSPNSKPFVDLSDGYWDRVARNFAETNDLIPDSLHQVSNLATGSVTARAFGLNTWLDVLSAARVGAPTNFLVGGALTNSAVHGTIMYGWFQAGNLVGSMINSIPLGSNGYTVRTGVSYYFQMSFSFDR